MVDPLDKEEVFIFIFPSIGDWSAVNDVIQGGLNLVVEIMEGFALLDACLNVVAKPLAEGAWMTIVMEVGVDWRRFSDLRFRWSFLVSGDDSCSAVVTWSGLRCWWCRRYGIP